MAGSIKPDMRGNCACGSAFKQVEEFNYSVPKCPSCGAYPPKLRISRYLPSLDGRKGQKLEIRYNQIGERLETVWDAIATMKLIDKELKEGTFDPRRFGSKEVSDQLRFKYFIENKYLPSQEKRVKRGELSISMLKKKLGYRKHLAFFDNYDVRAIGPGRIREWFDSWESKLRTRDLVTQELKTILNYACDLEFINSAPKFPKLKPAKKREAYRFLNSQEQEKIISLIDDPNYKMMIQILSHFAMRPCEVRALKWCDLDFKERIISISRHFSGGNHLVSGRKSNQLTHYLPMTDEFLEIISALPRSIVSDNFVFLGKNGGAVADRCLARAWHKAREQAGVREIGLYEGTKHSRLSLLKAKGHSDEELILLSGHTNIKTVQRYAQLKDSQKLNQVRSLLN